MRKFDLLAVTMVLVLSASNSNAMDDQFCMSYAREATDQQTINIRDTAPGSIPSSTMIPDPGSDAFSCGFSGPRWTSDWNAHYQWCLGATYDQINAESTARDNAINHCDLCRYYAKEVLEQAATERHLHCKFTGVRWRDDSAGRFQWCMSQSHDPEAADTPDDSSFINAVRADLSAGQKQIDACKTNRIEQRMSIHKPEYNAIKRRAGSGKADLGSAGKGINQNSLDDPNCFHCKSTNSNVAGPAGAGLLESDQGTGFANQAPAASGSAGASVAKLPLIHIDR